MQFDVEALARTTSAVVCDVCGQCLIERGNGTYEHVDPLAWAYGHRDGVRARLVVEPMGESGQGLLELGKGGGCGTG